MDSKYKKRTFSAIINNIVENIKEFIKLKSEYYTLTIAEKVSLLIARIVLIGIITLLCLILLLLLILLIYILLISWIGIPWVVALIEIGIVILLIVILWGFKKQLIIKPIASLIIRDILEKTDNEQED
ncbi:MAG: hypothetical protein LBQ22_07230 [Bacteroidales bacterium]|jgi:hypothetical protein|nr:hypothetical protein [Bacteroidales bacterium]